MRRSIINSHQLSKSMRARSELRNVCTKIRARVKGHNDENGRKEDDEEEREIREKGEEADDDGKGRRW